MDKQEFARCLCGLLGRTIDEGPGARAVVRITAESLAVYIKNEAGAGDPDAVEEAVSWLRGRHETLTPALMGWPEDAAK